MLTFSGERLRELRKAAGLTIDVIASHCGVHRSAVGHWETGYAREPRGGALLLLAELLGCQPADLYTRPKKSREK